jgi:hypothetical protein
MLGPYWIGDRPQETVEVEVTRNGEAIGLGTFVGAEAELSGPDGEPLDSSAITARIEGDVIAVNWPTAVSLFMLPGTYTLQVVLVGETSRERVAVLPFDVRAVLLDTGTQWCTPRDVLTLTGKVVDTDDIERAAGIIDSYTGAADLTVSKLSTRNRRALRNATAYQAAWMAGQFDTFDRHDVTSLSTEQGSFTPRDVTSMTLAPLAKTALRRTSWSGSRTERVRPRNSGLLVRDPIISDAHPWNG